MGGIGPTPDMPGGATIVCVPAGGGGIGPGTYVLLITSPLNALVPFNLTLPSTTPDGKAVKTVEINFVSADCDATPGATVIGSAQLTVFFQGQNGFYHLGFGPPQIFVNATEFVISQTTLMFADPGSTVNFGITGLLPTCTVVFSGHLIPK